MRAGAGQPFGLLGQLLTEFRLRRNVPCGSAIVVRPEVSR